MKIFPLIVGTVPVLKHIIGVMCYLKSKFKSSDIFALWSLTVILVNSFSSYKEKIQQTKFFFFSSPFAVAF